MVNITLAIFNGGKLFAGSWALPDLGVSFAFSA